MVGSWFWALLVLAVIVGAVGGWGTVAAHVDPGTVETTTEETALGVDGSFEHSATVQRENPVFPAGETLTDRSTYFTRVSPVLNGTFTADYESATDAPAEITMEGRLVHRAVDEETVYWTSESALAETDAVTVDSGEAATLEFSVNASEAADERDAITESLGGSPGELETFVAVDVEVASAVSDGPSNVSYTARLPISLNDDTYAIGEPTDTSEQVTVAVTETEPRERGPLLSYGGPVMLLLGLVGLGGLGLVHRRYAPLSLTPEERALLDYRDQRAEFDEWVVRAELPEGVLDREESTAASFADLVDFAIDANVAVIEEPTREQYYAVTPDLLVTYDPPEPIEER